MSTLDLLSTTNRVESPFIIVKIGQYSFGGFNKGTIGSKDNDGYYITDHYPNFVKSLTVQKVNGAVNQYTLEMVYAIKAGDDPNFLDKVLSATQIGGDIIFTYGDWSIPSYIYKEEQAVITSVTSSINHASSTILYVIKATSTMIPLNVGNFTFPKRHKKPSEVIKSMLYDSRYGLLDLFTGMYDKDKVATAGLIASDDNEVDIEAKTNISILDYLNYLVSCMTCVTDVDKESLDLSARYMIAVYDDYRGEFGGAYFKVSKISKNMTADNSANMYSIDIGYPSNNYVINFSLDDDRAYTIYYNYNDKVEPNNYGYRVNDKGEIEEVFSNQLYNSKELYKVTESNRVWWSKVTQYPVTATLTIKGLLKPAILMTYLKINSYFYGRKHISSGVYIITQQVDTISESGYRTTLKLTRISGDDNI